MAIAQVNGTTGNSAASAVASQASGSLATTTGNDVVVVVVLGSTSSSVSSITTSGGSYTSWTLRASKNGTGVRVEVWTAHVTTGATNTFTANITGGNTTCGIAVEQYSGVSSIGNTGTASGNSRDLESAVIATQDGNNWIVGGLGFANNSGDTLTALLGTSRQSSIPAATASAVALYDNSTVVDAYLIETYARISTSRQWAAATIELRSGGSAITATDYAAVAAPVLQTSTFINNSTNLYLLFVEEPLFCQSVGLKATNSGFVA
jgi:hypothetical protein